MGKSSLILVLGMSVIIGFFILKMNVNSKENLSTTVNMFEQTHSRLIANSGIEIYLEKLFFDHSLLGTSVQGIELFNGEYDVEITGNLDSVRIKSTATFMDVTHISVVIAELFTPEVPDIKGGLYIPTYSLRGAKNLGNGTLRIDGRDYEMNANPGVQNPPKLKDPLVGVPGITVDNQEDKDYLINAFGSFLNSNIHGMSGGNYVTGAPAISVTNENFDWRALIELLTTAYDFLINAENKDKIPSEIGTIANPKVTLINEPDPKKTVMINGNITGAGIMVVNGNVNFLGGLNYNGLIFCYRESKMEFTLSGTSSIFGGIIAAGDSVEFKGAGTTNVYYSSDAIINISNNMEPLAFNIKSWWE